MTASELVQTAVRAIREGGRAEPRIGMILGSGMGALAGEAEDARRIPYASIPGFQPVGVHGHAGELVLGNVAERDVAILAGRYHAYEGHRFDQLVFPTRVLAALGVRTLVVTNAAGGIREDLVPGRIMAISDHLNLMGNNPLIGPNDAEMGPRFPDLSDAYSRDLRERAFEAARKAGITLASGVYAAGLGPSYETPAEIRMLRVLGADAVGMSTVPEVIAANHAGLKILAFSLITNRAAGLAGQSLSHDEVLTTGRMASGELVRLLRAVLEIL